MFETGINVKIKSGSTCGQMLLKYVTCSFYLGKKRTANLKMSCFEKRKLMGACHKDYGVSPWLNQTVEPHSNQGQK